MVSLQPSELFMITFLIVSVMVIIIIKVFFPNMYQCIFTLFKKKAVTYNPDDVESINKAIDDAGYVYDSNQDIFYSKLNAWQRDMGYCRLYDEAAAPLSMIIDCEPICFKYDNRRWLIEFWKGQYGMTTGCEIGVYVTDKSDVHNELYNGPFYDCASDDDLLKMSYVLRKNGNVLFQRKDTHWWLTGFKLGEFSQPWELSVEITIQLKNNIMRNQFIKGLLISGYLYNEINVSGNSVHLIFSNPRTEQPYTRTESTDQIFQLNNKDLCEEFAKTTSGYDNLYDKLKAVQKSNPNLFNSILLFGKTMSLFER